MAEEGELDVKYSPQIAPVDDVFENGEEDTARNNNLLHPEYNMLPEQVLPRRSSLVKDGHKKSKDRKKTVSFSSMPNEKTVVNGMYCFKTCFPCCFRALVLGMTSWYVVEMPKIY